jgi:adenylyltransferase/sulfurtransferase
VIEAINSDLTGSNLGPLLTGRSIVLDCTDNFTTRLLLHDACLEAGIPLVQAAVHQWEGVLNIFKRGAGGCLYCTGLPRHPTDLDHVGSCTGAPIFGPAVGTLGLLQATEAIKVLIGRSDDELATHHTLLVDLLSIGITRIARPARPDCPFCSRVDSATAVSIATDPSSTAEAESAPLWLSSEDPDLLTMHRVIVLATDADRSSHEWFSSVEFVHPDDTAQLDVLVQTSDRPVALACVHGIRSAATARMLRAAGHARVFAIEGGLPRSIGLRRPAHNKGASR